MRSNARIIVALAASAAGAASSARASAIVGEPIEVSEAGSVSISFVSQSAGARGHLYFLGVERGGSITEAASSDSRNLGRFLFSNHDTSAGDSAALGDFLAGDILHFAYRIDKGASRAKTNDVFNTSVEDDRQYFALSSPVQTEAGGWERDLFIEDIRVERNSDLDYNDAVFRLSFEPVPTPGAGALAMTALGIATRRRR